MELSREPDRITTDFVKRQHPIANIPQINKPLPPRAYPAPPAVRKFQISPEEKSLYKSILEDLIGTRGAEILDNKLAVLSKVPISEIQNALKSISNVHAVVFDGSIEREIVKMAEDCNVKYLIGMDSKARQNETRINLLTVNEL